MYSARNSDSNLIKCGFYWEVDYCFRLCGEINIKNELN